MNRLPLSKRHHDVAQAARRQFCEYRGDWPDVGSHQPTAVIVRRLSQLRTCSGTRSGRTPPGGMVAATVSAEPGTVRLDVRDTGEGVRPEDVPHVFERFFRGRSLNGEGGAGLGLALVKELTEAMGGTVEASSTVGEGSCFTVRLPVSS